MKQIKFRAWDKVNKCFVGEGDIFTDKTYLGVNMYAATHKNVEWKDIEWQQFTGLLDENGREVYEGDICEHLKDGRLHVGIFYLKDESLILCFDFWLIANEYGKLQKGFDNVIFKKEFGENVRVIGNIHEHPELLDEPK